MYIIFEKDKFTNIRVRRYIRDSFVKSQMFLNNLKIAYQVIGQNNNLENIVTNEEIVIK